MVSNFCLAFACFLINPCSQLCTAFLVAVQDMMLCVRHVPYPPVVLRISSKGFNSVVSLSPPKPLKLLLTLHDTS